MARFNRVKGDILNGISPPQLFIVLTQVLLQLAVFVSGLVALWKFDMPVFVRLVVLFFLNGWLLIPLTILHTLLGIISLIAGLVLYANVV